MDIAGLLDDVVKSAKERKWSNQIFGGGLKGAALRGLLGADPPEDASAREMDVYRNFANASMATAAGPLVAIRGAKAAKAAKALPQEQALETARQNAVKMLGLPESNTAADRARALGYTKPNYTGSHQAPTSADDVGGPLHDLSKVYPSDIYSSNAARYYGDGAEPARDAALVRRMQTFRNQPNAQVAVFRAVPKDAGKYINHGDWVTMDKQYAKDHGESVLNGKYKIIFTRTPARTLFTDGNSIYELGIDKAQKFAEGPASMPTLISNKAPFERGRFAAFDPARINENDLLASLAALGIGIPLVSGLLEEER